MSSLRMQSHIKSFSY